MYGFLTLLALAALSVASLFYALGPSFDEQRPTIFHRVVLGLSFPLLVVLVLIIAALEREPGVWAFIGDVGRFILFGTPIPDPDALTGSSDYRVLGE